MVNYLNKNVLSYLARKKLRGLGESYSSFLEERERARLRRKHGTWDVLRRGYSYNGELKVTPFEAKMVLLTRLFIETIDPFTNSLLEHYEQKTYERMAQGKEGKTSPPQSGMQSIRRLRLEEIAALPRPRQRELLPQVMKEEISTGELRAYLALKTLESGNKNIKRHF